LDLTTSGFGPQYPHPRKCHKRHTLPTSRRLKSSVFADTFLSQSSKESQNHAQNATPKREHFLESMFAISSTPLPPQPFAPMPASPFVGSLQYKAATSLRHSYFILDNGDGSMKPQSLQRRRGQGSSDAFHDRQIPSDTNLWRPHLGVNFTNILRAAFAYERVLTSISLLTVLICNYLSKEY